LKLLAETLLEHEVIDGEDIKRLLEGKKLKNPKNNNKSATKSKPVKPTTKLTKTASPKKPVKKESPSAAKTDDK